MDAWTLFRGLRDVRDWPVEPIDMRLPLARGRKALDARLRTAWVTTILVGGVLLLAGLGARTLVHASPGPPTDDVVPPQVPRDLNAVAVSPELVNLSWSAAVDDLEIAGYTVFRDGEEIATVDGSTLAYADASVQPGTEYGYRVDAFDAAGNHSEPSEPARVTTPRRVDDQPPTAPTDLTAEATGPNEVVLAWTPSRDDTAVAGYSIYRDGVEVATVDGLTVTYTDVEVQPSATYTYTVRGFDASGNLSALSNEAEVTTSPPEDTEPPSAPEGVSVDQAGTGLSIQWRPSTDDVGIAGYRILRDGSEIGSVDGVTTSFEDTTADICADYLYEVLAFDASGNDSTAGSQEYSIVC